MNSEYKLSALEFVRIKEIRERRLTLTLMAFEGLKATRGSTLAESDRMLLASMIQATKSELYEQIKP